VNFAGDDLPDEITPFVHAINRLLARVNLLIGQQRRFVADAAHELRSPLTALSLQAQNLMHAGSLDAVRERVVPLQDGIERARHLTEQLLSLARTQASVAEESMIDVSEMARELIAERLPLAEAKGIDLGLEETATFFMRGSREALRLIVSNALENALKYTPKGGEVTLRLLSDGNGDVIEVVDNGPGIPISERERVLDAFYRVPGADGEGSGLGLAIAREAAIRLGGIVSLHERCGGTGLVFRYR
jgi:two-component system OmpR family sensor kinase